jgi:flavodoxin
MPMALYTFLDEYDLNGKTIAPFTTSGGSGLSGTLRNIEDEEPNATVTEGLAIRDDNVKNSQNTVIEWLSEIGF